MKIYPTALKEKREDSRLTLIKCSMILWVHYMIILFNLIAIWGNFTKEEIEAGQVMQHSSRHTAVLESESECVIS